MNAVLKIGQVSLLHHINPSDHSVSNHPSSPPGPTWFSTTGLTVAEPFAAEPHPLGRVSHDVTWASPLASWLATTKSRIEFVILRTGHSHPVALHLLSQERSYLLLRGSGQTSARTFTSLIRCACRRTSPGCNPGLSQTTGNCQRNRTSSYQITNLPNHRNGTHVSV